eukprot:s1451_g5.t1
MDATASLERVREEEKVQPMEASQTVIVLPRKGQMTKGRLPKPVTPVALEEEEERVLGALLEELRMMGSPILGQMEASRFSDRIRKSLLGKYRASTAKRYLAYWQGFRRWCMAGTGQVPSQPAQLVDYLFAREEEGMGPSVPLSISKSVTWFEKVSGMRDILAFSQDPLVETVVRDLLKKLEEGAPPRKRAPRLLSAFIPALEWLTIGRKVEDRIKAGAWIKLVKVWRL